MKPRGRSWTTDFTDRTDEAQRAIVTTDLTDRTDEAQRVIVDHGFHGSHG